MWRREGWSQYIEAIDIIYEDGRTCQSDLHLEGHFTEHTQHNSTSRGVIETTIGKVEVPLNIELTRLAAFTIRLKGRLLKHNGEWDSFDSTTQCKIRSKRLFGLYWLVISDF